MLDRPYCSVEDVQGIAGVTDPDATDIFEKAINQASRLVDEECGRDFWFHDHTTTPFVVPKNNVVDDIAMLPFEVITLTAVTIDGSPLDVANIEASGRALVNGGSWGGYPFSGKLELTGTFGHAITSAEAPPASVPSSIRRATALIAASFSNEWRKERVGADGSRESLLEVRIPAEARTLMRKWDIRKQLSTF